MTAENPFSPVHSRASFLETPGIAEALRRLDDGLGAREPFLLVTGEPGTGKTTLACEAIARWDARVTAALLAYSALSGTELLEEILRRFGTEPPEGAGRSKLVAAVERVLAEITATGRVAVLVLDDAHDLPLEAFEELRLLANAAQRARHPLEVMLVGLPRLAARLAEPSLEVLRQRVAVRVVLEPMSPAETRHYLHHRVSAAGGDGPGTFSRKTAREIAARTGGVARRVNALAAESLRVARAWGDPSVGIDHVQTAAATLGGYAAAALAAEPGEGSEEAAPPSPPAAKPVVALPPAPAPVVRVTPVTPAAAPPVVEEFTLVPSSAASQDPREWVARFVGDKGPLQISAMVMTESPRAASAPESSETDTAAAPGPAPRGRHARGRPRSRARHRDRTGAITGALLAAIVVAGAIFGWTRMRGREHPRVAQVSTVSAPAAVQPPAPRAAVVRAAPAPPRAAAIAAPAAPAVPPPMPAGPAPRGPFTLEVGAASDLDAAWSERARLQELTGIEGWVVSERGEREGSYRIVLGTYRSHERATAAADMLRNTRTLDVVTVAPLPPRSDRQ